MRLILTPVSGGIALGKRLYSAPKVREHHAAIPVKTVFMSDLHLRRKHTEHAIKTLDTLAALEPELVLLGGDLAEYAEGEILVFDELRARLPNVPVCAVPGNNDEYLFSCRDDLFKTALERNIHFLTNELKTLNINGFKIEIAGADDSFKHTPDISGLFSRDEGVYRIILSHEPHSFLPEGQNADLMLAGHTHGGQLNLFGLTCYSLGLYEGRYEFTHIAGEKHIGKTLCVVSRGVGYSKLMVRIGAESAIELITE